MDAAPEAIDAAKDGLDDDPEPAMPEAAMPEAATAETADAAPEDGASAQAGPEDTAAAGGFDDAAATAAPDAAAGPSETPAAMAEESAGDAGEGPAVAVDAAPSVKEIIRRVGDLARELEKAEAHRKATREHDAAGDEPAADAAVPVTGGDDPPLERAANA
jgi:hypothetical protein